MTEKRPFAGVTPELIDTLIAHVGKHMAHKDATVDAIGWLRESRGFRTWASQVQDSLEEFVDELRATHEREDHGGRPCDSPDTELLKWFASVRLAFCIGWLCRFELESLDASIAERLPVDMGAPLEGADDLQLVLATLERVDDSEMAEMEKLMKLMVRTPQIQMWSRRMSENALKAAVKAKSPDTVNKEVSKAVIATTASMVALGWFGLRHYLEFVEYKKKGEKGDG